MDEADLAFGGNQKHTRDWQQAVLVPGSGLQVDLIPLERGHRGVVNVVGDAEGPHCGAIGIGQAPDAIIALGDGRRKYGGLVRGQCDDLPTGCRQVGGDRTQPGEVAGAEGAPPAAVEDHDGGLAGENLSEGDRRPIWLPHGGGEGYPTAHGRRRGGLRCGRYGRGLGLGGFNSKKARRADARQQHELDGHGRFLAGESGVPRGSYSSIGDPGWLSGTTTDPDARHLLPGALMSATPEPRPAGTDPNQWVDTHADNLFRYALTRLRRREDAEDAVQETLLAALQAQRAFRGDSAELTWLMGILRHKIVDRIRLTARDSTLEALPAEELDEWHGIFDHWRSPPKSWSGDPAKLSEDAEFWQQVRKCFAALPERQAQIFALRTFDELEAEDICKQTGVSATNLWVLLHRARLRLRACLEETWFTPESTP